MTAIPEPTEEDKTVLLKIEQAYEEIEEELRICDYYLDGDKIADWKYEQRLIRLLSHYQRENERLERENDELRQRMEPPSEQAPWGDMRP